MELTIIPTWRCQLYNIHPCPYCDYQPSKDGHSVTVFKERVLNIGNELDSSQWLEWLKRIPASTINFTGGEPTVYKGFKELVNRLPDKHRWAITSNTLPDITGIDPLLCKTWTASFHPSAGQELCNRFLRNIYYLRSIGFSMSISIVAYPSTLDILSAYITKFQQAGFKVGILPFYTRGFDWRQTDKYEQIQKFLPFVEENPNLWWEESHGHKLCSAGDNYLTIQPDGEIWRCYSGFIQLEESHHMGNIKDHPIAFNDGVTGCDIPCLFPCDWLRSKRAEEAADAQASS